METRRHWLGMALGVGLAGGTRPRGWKQPGPVALWVADAGLGRGPEGGALLGLDGDCLVREVRRLPAPLGLGHRAGRGWVLVHRGSGVGRGPLELWEWGRLGILACHPVAGPFALDPEGRPWVLRTGRTGEQTLFDPDGCAVLSTRGGFRPIAGRGGVWVGNRAGELFAAGPGGLTRQDQGVQLLGLAASTSGPVWVGRCPRGRYLARVGRAAPWELAAALRARLGGASTLLLAPGPDGGVWLCAEGTRRVELARPGGRGQLLELESSPRGLHADRDGGVTVLMPGAIARVNRYGQRRPGQGGLASGQDLVRVGAPPKPSFRGA